MMKPITTEKAVRLIELENTLTFTADRRKNKEEIKKDFEEVFNVKVEKIRTSIRQGKKYCYIRLKKENPAIDIATKLGMM